MENSSAGQSMCIGGDGAGVAGLGPPFLSLHFLPRVQEKKPASAEPWCWSIHLERSQQEKRETGRLMAAIRARIKMVGPRQLYRLGSDGAVGMRLYRREREERAQLAP